MRWVPDKDINKKSGSNDFETKGLPDLNRLVQTAETGDEFEYETNPTHCGWRQ